jgi:endonuclease/exonuclease/phosphatase family metal-dependent hydrolase
MPSHLRAVTYNVLLGGERREDSIAAVLERCDADIIALQEACDLGLVRRLAERMHMRMAVGKPSDRGRLNLAVLSRHPFTRWRNHRHPGRMLRAHLECEVAVGDHTHRIRVHNLHLAARFGERANGEERRMRELGAILGDIRRSGNAPHLLLGDFNAVAPGDVVAARDFFARLSELRRAGLMVRGLDGLMGPRGRTAAVDRALDEAYLAAGIDPALEAGLPRLPWIVGSIGGVLPRTQVIDRVLNRFIERWCIPHLLQAGYTDCYRALHDDRGYTCATWMPAVRVDYVFADGALAERLRSCEVVGGDRHPEPAAAAASDHFPVLAEFAL